MHTLSVYAALEAGQAIKVHGQVVAKAPPGAARADLVQLQQAAARYARFLANRARTSLQAWADAIAGDTLAGIDPDAAAICAALRRLVPPPAPAPATPHGWRAMPRRAG